MYETLFHRHIDIEQTTHKDSLDILIKNLQNFKKYHHYHKSPRKKHTMVYVTSS